MTDSKPPRTPSRRPSRRVAFDPRLLTTIEEPQGVGIELWEARKLKNRLRRFFDRLSSR